MQERCSDVDGVWTQVKTAEEYALKLSTMQMDFKPAAYPSDTFEWTFLPLVWARVGAWDSILDMEKLPERARGLCFAAGAHEYATVVWHYVRVLAYAGQADASRARGTPGEAVLWDSLADKEASLLEVR